MVDGEEIPQLLLDLAAHGPCGQEWRGEDLGHRLGGLGIEIVQVEGDSHDTLDLIDGYGAGAPDSPEC